MSEVEARDFSDVTTYSPVRVFLAGLWRMLFGAVLGLAACVLIVNMVQIAGEPNSDLPLWCPILFASLLGLAALAAISGGLGRTISAFARNCYFRAGREGIAVRMPRQRWYGRFRLREFRFKWSEVDRVVHFTYRTNGIKTSTELRIYLNDGTRLTVDRMYFSADVWSIQHQLATIRASVGK